MLGLLLAVMRSLPGPGLLPDPRCWRSSTSTSSAASDDPRDRLLGFGFPALQLQGCRRARSSGASSRSSSSTRAYVAEVYRAGIDSVHPSQNAAARSLGLSTRLGSLRFVVVPQAVRRVVPPLLNDFIGLQKDTALLRHHRRRPRRSGRRRSTSQRPSTSRRYVALALVFILFTIPARPVRRLADGA